MTLKNIVPSCAILIVLLLLPVLFSRAQVLDDAKTVFSEEFNGTILDASKWVAMENTNMSGYPAYGGSIQVATGQLTLSSNGSSFPFVYSASNLFPDSGDFSVEFAVTYTCIADSGCGIMLSSGFPVLDTAWHNRVFTLWAADEGTDHSVIYIELFNDPGNSVVYRMTVPGFKPSSPQHIYNVTYESSVYSIYVDGTKVASAESQIRPTMIVIGNPSNPEVPQSPQTVHDWGYWGWSAFNVDYIRVDTPGNNEVNMSNAVEITMLTSTEAQEIGYRVDITGTLTYEDKPIPDAQVFLSYAIPAIPDDWETITVVTTDSDGTYSASWLPTATGLFTLKAAYTGSADYDAASTAKNISVLQSVGKNFFFVESNSTLSSLAFNSTSKELLFSVSGPSGTNGYVKFMVPKELVPDASVLKVFLDGKQLQYTVDSESNNWLLSFNYSHSTHAVVISITQASSDDVISLITLVAIVALALAAPVAFMLLFRKFKKR